MWQQRDFHAYKAWIDINSKSPEGVKARSLLRKANAHYLDGIRLFENDDPKAARELIKKGASIAPINPVHFFALGRVYSAEGKDERAARCYNTLIDILPDSKEAQRALMELSKLDLKPGAVFEPLEGNASPELRSEPEFSLTILIIGIASGILIAFSIMFIFWRGRGVPLGRLVDENPELHAAIAYLVGSLRHELLKHRIGVVKDVLAGMHVKTTTVEQQAFLRNRLFGDVPLKEAWNAHLLAFLRALGHRLNLRKDRAFHNADRAIHAISQIDPASLQNQKRARVDLERAHRQLRDFDKYLAQLLTRMVRTRVDDELLRHVVDEVRGEYSVSNIALDELWLEPVKGPVQVEVARVDLVLILKNILRNAILAVAKNNYSKRVGIFTRVELEATGEESVRISICDSNDTPLSEEMIQAQGLDSGLGLVMTAVKRYGGTLTIVKGEDRFKKEVVVRFFRAFQDEGN